MSLLTRLGGTVTISAGDVSRNFSAVDVGEGMYKSQVTIPSAGVWTVRIYNGFGAQSGTSFKVAARGPVAPTPPAMLPYDRGLQLYEAKGCANCHSKIPL